MWNLIGFSRRHNYSTAVEKDRHTTVNSSCFSEGWTSVPVSRNYRSAAASALVRQRALPCSIMYMQTTWPEPTHISPTETKLDVVYNLRQAVHVPVLLLHSYIQTAVWGFKAWKDVNAVKTVRPACGKIKMAVGLWLLRVNNRLRFKHVDCCKLEGDLTLKQGCWGEQELRL